MIDISELFDEIGVAIAHVEALAEDKKGPHAEGVAEGARRCLRAVAKIRDATLAAETGGMDR